VCVYGNGDATTLASDCYLRMCVRVCVRLLFYGCARTCVFVWVYGNGDATLAAAIRRYMFVCLDEYIHIHAYIHI